MSNIPGFDWEFYLNYNTDVKDTFGYNKYGALLHYSEHGEKEGRIFSEHMLFKRYPFLIHFDWEFYRDNNFDLIKLSRYQLIDHYINQGHKEKRSVLFSTPIYNYLQDTSLVEFKSQSPKISIIVPVYNRPEYVKDSINSLINQSYLNWEIIIIDDGSNFSTKTILKEYINHPNIIVLSNEENYGCYISINLALGLCTGDYITIHGSDDISLPNRLAMLMEKAITNNLLMVGNYILRTHFSSFKDINIKDLLFEQIVMQKMDNVHHNSECCKPLVSLGTLVYHKSVFKDIGYYENIRKGGDMVFFEKFLAKYENVIFTKYDCSHRYLTKVNKGKYYAIVEEILYLSPEMTNDNITNQNIRFDINKYR